MCLPPGKINPYCYFELLLASQYIPDECIEKVTFIKHRNLEDVQLFLTIFSVIKNCLETDYI